MLYLAWNLYVRMQENAAQEYVKTKFPPSQNSRLRAFGVQICSI